jgi:hypothetical protein
MVNPVEILFIKALEGAASLARGSENNNISQDALLLGQADGLYRPKQKENIYLSEEERLRHTYILGATGIGKSKLLEFLVRQDIFSGRGFCLIDPHGDLYQNILNFIARLSTIGDQEKITEYISRKLVLIDPAGTNWVVGFNPLEAAQVDPYAQALEFMGIFKKLWSDAYWGPRMEELLRNTLLTLSLNGLTLLEAKAVLVNPSFRARMAAGLPPCEAKEYWLNRFDRLRNRTQRTYSEPLLNRLSVFVSDPAIRAMVGQAKSTLNFRRIMDQGRWLLVNLSKGKLKGNAYLLGSLFVAKLQLAALSRADIPEKKRSPFYVFVDEFQNLLGQDFETILSEARKYGLGLTLVHQNIDQLNRQLRAAILGNAFSQIFFRLSDQDAGILSRELGQRERPMIRRRLVDLRIRQAYLKKKGERPRLITTYYTSRVQGTAKSIQNVKSLSFSRYARPRHEADREIAERELAVSQTESVTRPKNGQDDPYAGKFAPRKEGEAGYDW